MLSVGKSVLWQHESLVGTTVHRACQWCEEEGFTGTGIYYTVGSSLDPERYGQGEVWASEEGVG